MHSWLFSPLSYGRHTELRSSYTENTRNEYVSILRIARKVEYIGGFKTKAENTYIVRDLSIAETGPFGQTTLNKKSHASVPLNSIFTEDLFFIEKCLIEHKTGDLT